MGTGRAGALPALERQSRCGFPAVLRDPLPREIFAAFSTQGRAPALTEVSFVSGHARTELSIAAEARPESLSSPGAPGPLGEPLNFGTRTLSPSPCPAPSMDLQRFPVKLAASGTFV